MRVAIFHDYFGAIGGGERLVLILARELGADIITSDVNRESIHCMGFDDVRVISLGNVIQTPPFKQIHASFKFALSRFPEYDFFIFSGNWAHYASRNHHPNMWYCHTPVRFFYDLKAYFIKNQKTPVHRIVAKIWISLHSWFDGRSVRRIDRIVTNSENTKKRIAIFYHRDAMVIYPPVDAKKFRYSNETAYWLSVNRLYPEKRIPLQIEVFRRLPDEHLKIVGGYSPGDHAAKNLGYLAHLPVNVELLGSVSDEELIDLYSRCKGLICTAMDEDFGMTPLEAMAAGKPVVAPREGGFLESVVDTMTGRLVEATPEGIIEGIREISERDGEYFRDACRERAEQFDIPVFAGRIREAIRDTQDRQN